MSTKTNKNTESKEIMTKEEAMHKLAEENKSLLKSLEAAEKRVFEYAKDIDGNRKNIAKQVAIIDRDGLYKARGYTSINKYAADKYLAGLSDSSVSQYLNVGRKFMLAEDADRQKLAVTLNFTQLAEILQASDSDVKNFANNENTAATPAKELKKQIQSPEKVRVVKHYDYSGIVSKPAEGAQWYPFTVTDVDDDYFTESNGISLPTVSKVGKLENGLKDSYAFTALNKDMTSIFYYTRVPHVTKAENNLTSTPDARRASLKEYLATLTAEEKAEFLASLAE